MNDQPQRFYHVYQAIAALNQGECLGRSDRNHLHKFIRGCSNIPAQMLNPLNFESREMFLYEFQRPLL
jgi:hypothetical protein